MASKVGIEVFQAVNIDEGANKETTERAEIAGGGRNTKNRGHMTLFSHVRVDDASD